MTIGPLAFLVPWLLLGLVTLPILWWLLRAVPPAPARRPFPGVRLLLGLIDPERMPERTPWWLLVLRMLALGAAIVAFAGPVLNQRPEGLSGPLVVLVDGGWGDAPDWTARRDRVAAALAEAGRAGRPAAVLSLAARPPAEGGLPLRAAGDWLERLAGLAPRAWAPDRAAWAAWFAGLDEDFETVWLTDGIGHGGEADLARSLLARGPVTLVAAPRTALALTPPRLEAGEFKVTVLRAATDDARPVGVTAVGPDPSGVERALGSATGAFAAGEAALDLTIDLPVELRNRVARVQLADGRSAAGVVLADDSVRRRKVGLISGRAGSEAQDLVDPMHFLRKALEPFAEIVEAPLGETLNTAPDVLILADVGAIGEAERLALTPWVEGGGLLVRFAGPRLAQSGAGQVEEDPLLPVRLRAGGRSIGGAMSWGAPRRLRPFPEASPFAGLPVPLDVDISSQVMAQPDPDLPDRVLASLEDGTPLVTGRALGEGRVVLFHVTANADWSSLPLSGLFVQMLERLTQSAGGLGPSAAALEGVTWTPVQVLNGFGDPETPSMVAGVPGERLAEGEVSEETPPGIYASGERRAALNVMRPGDRLAALAALPEGVVVETLARPDEVRLGPWLLALALLLLALDVLATLIVSGRFAPGARAASRAAAVALTAAALGAGAGQARAQDDAAALNAANHTVLAYVETGEPRVDEVSRAGLAGLSRSLYDRTAVEPADPVAIDLETDELSLYPFLYWPVTEGQAPPSDAAYGRLNDFLRFGGMILFDTRDADLGGSFGGTTPAGRALQRIALKLDVPPLEPVPHDHVLTRTFYLLQDFPGRWEGAPLWVEASPDAEEVEGMPFRNLNDGVTPVVIGGNDWAAAWAMQDNGTPMFPVGRGIAGERQREMAVRFGVNLIMHVMTGNYKSDQVHVPALLDRLGSSGVQAIAFDPQLPLGLIAALWALTLAVLTLALWRGLRGWWLRTLAALVLLAALAGPTLRQEDRAPVPSIALAVYDDSASNRIAGRPEQMAAAEAALETQLAQLEESGALEVRRLRVADRGEEGTALLTALAEAAAELPADRIAGAVLVTDGQVHDANVMATFPGPVHALLSGSPRDWDRRVVVETAPAFAIVGEAVRIVLKVEDLGAAPEQAGSAKLTIALDDAEPEPFEVPVNRPVTLPVTLQRGGVNVLQIATPEAEGELTDRNNAAIVSINGVRDRLRVLLVSGEPYPGERTWRNLLKSDSAVDLVHFTILRPPEKQDFVPVFELSLIAFPTQELFMEKVDEFDLIIFDRYKRRGILPNPYFENIARYVREGGALLIAAGEDFAGAESLYRSPLRDLLPVEPTARMIEEGFHPMPSAVGHRHPVTAALEEHAPRPPAEDGTPGWGRWFRMVEVNATSGEAVLEGPDGRPLLVLDRQGEGRIAVLVSDQAWLWSRGFEGGGPQLELLRRLAHWLMQEPELEEEVLRGTGEDGAVSVVRRTLDESVPPVIATSPAGDTRELALVETAPGRWEGRIEDAENGVWRLENGEHRAVAVVGPSAPREFEDPVSTGAVLEPLAAATRGGILRLEDGVPDVRMVREGRVASGRGWIGLADRDAYQLRDIRQVDLAPGWLMLLLAGGLAFAAWRIEGR